jgi:ElaB/YqjD/DUF883 family membrane-anchored ribosome-binding protein
MKNSASSIESAASDIGSGVSREFHSFLEDIEDLVKQTTSLTGDELARAKEKLSARVASAKESVEDMGHAAANRARKAAKATDRYVHEQPWKVIGASAAIAFLIGFALARRD